ncbi:MAG: glycosyltransferase family 39 protein [bacterium]|nr:glycosyltransferase family 39 protein [bacterium]MDW8163692.1 glycosyltransferase family 39 protein [Candidatus Omnitrophota bacterium]
MEKKTKFILFLIFLLGTFLRVLNIEKHSLWCDELLAISIGKNSIKWIVNYITFKDAHPPLFYVLVHYWLKIGYNEIILRTLPLFFGCLCIPISYIFGEKFKDEKIGLFLSLFIALSPPLILWSQILKSYSFLTFLTILSFIIFIEFIEKENKKYLWFFVFVNVLILYTHNFGFIVIFIQVLMLLILKKLNKNLILSLFFIFLFYIPWLLRIPHQLKFTMGVRRPLPIFLKLPYTLFYFHFGETLNPFNFKILIPASVIYLIIFLLSLKNLTKIQKEKKYILIFSIILPLIFVFFPSTVPQNLISYSVVWFMLFVFGIEKLSHRNLLVYLNFIFLLPSLFFYYTDNISQYHDTSKLIPFREIFKEIQKMEKQGDIILTTEKFEKDILTPSSWYYKGKNQILYITNTKEENLLILDEIVKNVQHLKTLRFFLILDFINNPEISSKVKSFFEKNFENLYEKKYVYNEKLLSRLEGKREYYYLVETYLFQQNVDNKKKVSKN